MVKKCRKVSETHSHNDGAGPVEGPYVLNVPLLFIDAFNDFPVFLMIDKGHGEKHWTNEMGKKYVE